MNTASLTETAREIHDLPSPRGLPLIGNLHQLEVSTHHQMLERWAAELGTPYVFRLGRLPVTVWSDAELEHRILRERPHRYRRFERIESILSEFDCNGVFSAEGRAWEPQRRLVMQALSVNHVKAFYPTLAAITERLRRRWEDAARAARVVDMIEDLKRFTVDVTSALAFGEDPNTLEKERDVIQEHLTLLLPTLMARLNAPFAYWHVVKLPRDRRFEHAMTHVHRHVRELMTRARERRRTRSQEDDPTNLLEAMLALRDVPDSGITDDDVAANVLTLLVAGEDTTATSIAWALRYLGSDDALQARVASHARGVLGGASVCPSYQAMRDLDWCEAVCTEAIRLHPIAPYLSFEPLEDVRLSGVRLPAGTKMFLLARPPMLDARHFADPTRYAPERWLADRHTTSDAHEPRAFMQFGAGPRVCPGRHLAAVEMRLVISMLMANFTARIATNVADIREVCAFTNGPSAMPMQLALRPGLR